MRFTFLSVLLLFVICSNHVLACQKGGSRKQDADRKGQSVPKRYAIVIHGGAGSSPAQSSVERNGLRRRSLRIALEKGRGILEKGGTSLDAVESVIRIMEDDPLFNAGKGAVFNSRGTFELDASIMDGRTRACGAVAAVSNTKNPITLARHVMTSTRHVLLSAHGANEFARQQKVELVPNIYFQTPASKARWQKQQKKGKSDGGRKKSAKAPAKLLQKESNDVHFGTVGCVALDQHGNIAAGTSTGGLSNKKYGRVGDSPVVGAGTFADNSTCGVSGTGIGEEFIRNAVAFDISARMKYKKIDLKTAAHEVVFKVLKPNQGGIIAIDSLGNITIQFNTKGMASAAADSTGRFGINWKKGNPLSDRSAPAK